MIALIGSTASGKTTIALRLARETRAHILSCDSLLVYKGLNIGTAKPSPEELKEVPHYGIDLIEPDQPFTAVDYVRYAQPILARLVADRTPVIIVGGTGFYLKALLCGVWDAPPTDLKLRDELSKETPEALYLRLTELDAEYAAKVKQQDAYRVIRALEIIGQTGASVTERLKNRALQNALPYPVAVFGIKREKTDLERRIAARTSLMFSQGIEEEAKGLLARFPKTPRSMECVGYYEVTRFLRGEASLEKTEELVMISTRQLAKKQMTFFRTFPMPIAWHQLPAQEEELLISARKALKP